MLHDVEGDLELLAQHRLQGAPKRPALFLGRLLTYVEQEAQPIAGFFTHLESADPVVGPGPADERGDDESGDRRPAGTPDRMRRSACTRVSRQECVLP
jgi:hypothetical protein